MMPSSAQPLLLLLFFIIGLPHLARAQDTPPGRAHTLTGRLQIHPQFHSRFLARDRDIIVYLPPDYDANPRMRYPVLYLHDGQNLFDGATSFIPGKEWRADETAQALIAAKAIAPLILVGIYNAGDRRLAEYTPSQSKKYGGGEANAYGRMLVEELKPFIDKAYRTRPDSAHTGLGGSSLGGLVSLYLGLKYPQTFGMIAALSPSVWWDDRWIVGYVKQWEAKSTIKSMPRIWLDMGTQEGPKSDWQENLIHARTLRDTLLIRGWKAEANLKYVEAEGAEHNETAWAARLGDVLKFLYPSATLPVTAKAQ